MINNKKAEFNLQGMLIGVLVVGLFFSLIALSVNMLGGNYDTEGYDADDITKYSNIQANLSDDINTVHGQIDAVVVDPNVWDYIAGIWNKITTPFKFVYRSFSTLTTLAGDISDDLKLLPPIKEFFITLITILVIIGLVMIKYYMGKRK